MNTLQKVIVSARKVRSWCESIAINNKCCLGGLCAKASAKLWRELKKFNIPAEIHGGNQHIFVVAEIDNEQHIVDVTATQFSCGASQFSFLREVVLPKKLVDDALASGSSCYSICCGENSYNIRYYNYSDKYYGCWWWKTNFICKTDVECRQQQELMYWPKDQLADLD